MQINEIMTSRCETVSADATLAQAAEKMRSLDVGSLPVVRKDTLLGMITDRDITVRAVAQGRDPNTTRVTDIMTPEIFYCYIDDDIHEAAQMMEEKAIHRLLVLNHNNQPVGFVALTDFAVKSHDERLAWEILERISEPASPRR